MIAQLLRGHGLKSRPETHRTKSRFRRARVTVMGGVMAVAVLATVPVATAAYAAGGWSAPTTVDQTSNFEAVSCPSTTFCTAVDGAGNVFYFNGTSWTADAANPIDPDGGGFSDVSCPTTTFCTAVDYDGDAYTYDGSAWTAYAANPIDAAGRGFTSVSCTSSTFCVAGDFAGNAFTFDGILWTPYLANPVDSSGALISVSCPHTPSLSLVCVGVSFGGNAYIYNGVTWTGTTIDPSNELDSVSCPTTSFCVAGDWDGNGFTYNGTGWSGAKAIDPSGNVINWVDCLSSTFCAAVDSVGNELLYNGSYWSGAPNIDPSVASGTFNLYGVSCPSTSLCVAVDFSSGNAFVYRSSTLQITSSNTLPEAFKATPYSATLSAQGGNPPYEWKLAKGSKLPKGLKLNKHTGAITGTPKLTDSGTYTLTVNVFDAKVKVPHHKATQNTDSRVFAITVS